MAASATPLPLSELAEKLGCELIAGGDMLIRGVAALSDASPDDLSFVRSERYRAVFAASRAGAVIVGAEFDPAGRPAIRAADPSQVFARAVELLVVPPRPVPGCHPGAVVDPDAQVDPTAALGPGVHIGAGSSIGARSVLHANVCVYGDVEVGADCELHGGVVLREGTRVGSRVRLQPGVLVGGDGFGFLPDETGAARRVPQVGRVVIEDDVEIGAGTTVDRATLGETRIRRGAKIDNLVMIAHNCDIGEDAIIVAQSGLAGGTRVGSRAILMARVGSAGQLEIGEGAFVGARSGLHHDVPAGGRVWGSPAVKERAWHREIAALRRLPNALRRLRRIEARLGLRPSSDASDPAES
jgi:UDP-3-O-[3-hydroxymyristoyl] glucosamine N-acyltransferase